MESLIRAVERTYVISPRKKYFGELSVRVSLFFFTRVGKGKGIYYTLRPLSAVSDDRSCTCCPIPVLAPAITTAQVAV